VWPSHRSEILSWTQKIYVMGSEMQPQIMRAQKSEQILIFEINKDYWHVFKYQRTIFNNLGLFMFIGSSIADTQHNFFYMKI
jgi:D-lyxose ketol-isomerase